MADITSSAALIEHRYFTSAALGNSFQTHQRFEHRYLTSSEALDIDISFLRNQYLTSVVSGIDGNFFLRFGQPSGVGQAPQT